jgi:hypothetical protein
MLRLRQFDILKRTIGGSAVTAASAALARMDIQILAALLSGSIVDPLAPDRARSQSAAMTKHLPHGDQAILDIRKIEGYCLNTSHPRGRHKGRVFREALDLQRSDASWLRDALLEAARSSEASPIAVNPWGTHWRLDATIRRQGRSAVVRTIW